MSLLKSFKYSFLTNILRRRYLLAKANRFDLSFNIIGKDVVGRSIYKRGDYEPEISEYIEKNFTFNEDEVFVDVGANVGWYSMLICKMENSPGKIFSFEPDELNYSLLLKNISINKCNNVEAINCALADECGNKLLYKYADKNLGRHSLLPINSGDEVEVKTTTLDDFWEKNVDKRYTPRMIKIDTEGFEYQVVSGAQKTLLKTPAVLAEFSPDYMLKGGVSPQCFTDFMKDNNFHPHLIKGGEAVVLSDEALLSIKSGTNILWLK